MSERRQKYRNSTGLLAAGAILTACGTTTESVPPISSLSIEYPTPSDTALNQSPAGEKISGKDTTIICRGIARIFVYDISPDSVTFMAEPDSAKSVQWHDLSGQEVTATDIPCERQNVYTHQVVQPSNKPVTVVTTSPDEVQGIAHVNMPALLPTNTDSPLHSLVAHDFGVMDPTAAMGMLSHLADNK